jgi:hypothetical protein
LFFSAVLVVLAHGSRWIRIDESGDLLPRRNWRWWGFFALKATLGLIVVLVLGIGAALCCFNPFPTNIPYAAYASACSHFQFE